MKNTHYRPTGGVRTVLSACLALCLCLSLLPALPVLPAAAESYFDPDISQLVSWGIMNGYPDGSLRPDSPITRAEFVAMVNRAYGFTSGGETPFRDVPAAAWYASDISVAYTAGYYEGGGNYATPESYLTREEALTILARNMRLDYIPGEVSEFQDSRSFSDWSRGYVKSAVERGLVNGYEDGTFRPQNLITRGEMAAILNRALGTLVNTSGVTSLGEVYGSVTVNRPGTTLTDTTIAGDLYVSGGLEDGSVTLDNVRVMGNIIVAGGGESEAGESLIMRNTQADNLVIDSLGNHYLSLRAEGETIIPETSVRSDLYLNDRTVAGNGLQKIYLEKGTVFNLAGNLEEVINKAPESTVRVAAGSLQQMTVDERAANSILMVDRGATIRNLDLDTGTSVTGRGDVDTMNIYAAGTTAEMLPDNVDIRPGVEAEVAGTTMDTSVARESSDNPRLLAGYPKMSNLAPTSATVTFAANKAGTVYWGVSKVSDGSISETELLAPPTYTAKIVRSGNLKITESKTEFPVNFNRLTAGTDYYLAAVMVDSRGVHSPIKVVTFTTPDNSTPAFQGGTPKLTLNSYDKPSAKYVGQVLVIPSKTCQLYWAVYPKGSNTPTEAEFRAGNLEGSFAHNMVAVTRNREEFVNLHYYMDLKELTDYDAYFWLNDADNGKGSAIRKLTFTTVDGTPPDFVTRPTMTNFAARTITLTATATEDCTFYWVAVLEGSTYPIPPTGGAVTEEQAQIQISNGIAGVSSGKANMKAHTPTTINVNRLQPETVYDIWFILQDKAGNYSAFASEGARKNYITQGTLDTSPPEVRQEFTRFNPDTPDTPYPNTDIKLIFDENIQHVTSMEPDLEELNGLRPLELYNIVADTSGHSALERAQARALLARLLESMIHMYDATRGNAIRLTGRVHNDDGSIVSGQDWVIDYWNARVEQDGKEIIVTFPTLNDSTQSALNLRSGSTYYFTFENIEDTAMPPVRMGQVTLDRFRILSAEVKIEDLELKTITVGTDEVPADIAFTITPEGTAQVDSSFNWDMIFWTDATCDFEVYRKRSTASNWAKTSESKRGSVIRSEGERSELLGQSLYVHLLDNEANVSHPISSTLVESWDYVIHLTRLNTQDENKYSDAGRTVYDRSAWSQNVLFRINIVGGTSRYLDLLTKDLTLTNYAQYVPSALSDIGRPTPFEQTAAFTDTRPPQFSESFPQLIPADTSARLSVRLNNAGTVYYVVAPANVSATSTSPAKTSPIETKRKYAFTRGSDSYAADSFVYYEHADVPDFEDSGIRHPVRINRAEVETELVGLPDLELSAPIRNDIVSPNFFSDTIFSGNFAAGRSAASVTIKGLTPETEYFLYLVLKGTGSIYSESPVLYRFKTEELLRPQFELTNQTTSVGVTTNLTTKLDYIVIVYNQTTLSSIDKLYDWFSDDKISEKKGGTAPKKEDGSFYRVYEAIEAVNPGNDPYVTDSVFDAYASDDYKRQVAEYIRGTAADGTRIIDKGVTTVDAARTINIRNMTDNVQYMFMSVGNTTQEGVVSGDSFHAISPLYLRDNDPPVVADLDISGLTISDEGEVSGLIQVIFNEQLYVNPNLPFSTLAQKLTVDQSKTALPTSQTEMENANYFVGAGALMPNGVNLKPVRDDSTKGNRISTVMILTGSDAEHATLTVGSGGIFQDAEKIKDGYISFNQYLCDNVPNSMNFYPRISLNTTVDDKGKATVTVAVTRNSNGATITKKLERTLPTRPVKAISLDPAELYLIQNGENGTVTASIDPSDTTSTLAWTINNTTIARIVQSTQSYAIIQPLKAGTARLTVSGDGVTAGCDITVNPDIVSLTVTRVSQEDTLRRGGDPIRLRAASTPAGAPGTQIQWSLSGDGKEYAYLLNQTGETVEVGWLKSPPNDVTVTVTATFAEVSGSSVLKVAPTGVESIGVSPTTLSLQVGGTGTVRALFVPTTASDDIDWSIDNPTIADLSFTEGNNICTVTAKGAGTATITATARSATLLSARCILTVTTGIKLDLSKESLDLSVGDTEQLIATVDAPEGAAQTVTWISRDESIAKVSTTGLVTAVAEGTTEIVVAADADNTVSKTCTVKVSAARMRSSGFIPVTGLDLTRTSVNIEAGTTAALKAKITPENATNQDVTWSSSNESVATVSNGTVRGVSPGSAVITAQLGDFSATCTVTVIPVHPTGVAFNNQSGYSYPQGSSVEVSWKVSPDNATNQTVTLQFVKLDGARGYVPDTSADLPTITMTGSNSATISGGATGPHTLQIITEDGGVKNIANVVVEVKSEVR